MNDGVSHTPSTTDGSTGDADSRRSTAASGGAAAVVGSSVVAGRTASARAVTVPPAEAATAATAAPPNLREAEEYVNHIRRQSRTLVGLLLKSGRRAATM